MILIRGINIGKEVKNLHCSKINPVSSTFAFTKM